MILNYINSANATVEMIGQEAPSINITSVLPDEHAGHDHGDEHAGHNHGDEHAGHNHDEHDHAHDESGAEKLGGSFAGMIGVSMLGAGYHFLTN